MSTQQTTHTTTKKQQLSPAIYRLLEKRGLKGASLEEFLSWDLKKLPNLMAMQDIDVAAKKILECMDQNKTIGIYGDYDVDGTTSCALFYHFFKLFDIEAKMIQPSRFIEGYGLHPSSVDKAIGQDIELLITVDCGITNNEAADYAKERGLDLIITDHHKDARSEMPEALAIVNPNRRDEPADNPLKVLAGVGVAFAICVKIRTLLEERGETPPTLYPLLQFVAIGTICDLAKLTPVNLKLVRHGLSQLTSSKYPGVKAFFTPEERQNKFCSSEKLSFFIGPMINSKGRLDHPEKALNLLCAADGTEAYENFSHLEISNKERKLIQAEVFEGARKQIMSSLGDHEHLISIAYQEDWHEGVIGIVASKLVETFKVPAIVFSNAEEEGIIKASARSAGDLSIFDCLNNCADLFVKFGGHKAAAGLSMPKENLDEFIRRMNEQLVEIPAIQRTVQNFYDIEIAAEEITPKLVKELEMLEPFGMGNEKPVFKMKGFNIDNFDLLKDVHVRWNLSSSNGQKKLRGISFNYIDKWGCEHPEELFKAQSRNELCAYFTLGINRFKGNEYVQLMVERISSQDI